MTSSPGSWAVVAWSVAVAAAAARLVPLLRGGGLTGLGNYDDGVYYAAGTALAHGRLPYADYLLLHPPGIVLALAPFGLLARLVGDPVGLAAARLGWIALGAVGSVLVARLLRGQGLVLAALGGLAYAVAPPAVYTGWTPMLETPAATCVLLALLVLHRTSPDDGDRGRVPARRAVLAGVLLGLSADLKIWGVASVLAVVAWYLARGARRNAAEVLLGALVSVAAVCLPFFLTSPGAMWRMVVLDQLGRGRSQVPLVARVAGILGVAGPGGDGAGARWAAASALVLAAGLAVVLVVAAARMVPSARLAVLLTVVHTGVLLTGPSWFRHYPALVTGPLVVATVSGAGALVRHVGAARPRAGRCLLAVLALAVAALALPLAGERLGTPFPGAALGAAARARAGCVTSDDPAALAAMDVLSSDLARGCPFVADLGGYSYELARERGRATPRSSDAAWQRLYLEHLRAGTTALPFRYAPQQSPSTARAVAAWPVLAGRGRFVLREPDGRSP